jgi:hypothetical protein
VSDVLQEIAGRRVLVCAGEGPMVRSERDAVDLIGDALGQGAEWVAVPVARLDPDFFRLAGGLAGAVTQKFVNYERRLAILGDIAVHLAGSKALTDWVRECNRGRHVWFLGDQAAFEVRLAGG